MAPFNFRAETFRRSSVVATQERRRPVISYVLTLFAVEPSPLARRRASPVQTYAKIAGVLLLLSFIAGGFGEAYVPSKLVVATDAAATVENLKSSDIMFRLGFAGYLVRHRTSESHARSALESIQLAVRGQPAPRTGRAVVCPDAGSWRKRTAGFTTADIVGCDCQSVWETETGTPPQREQIRISMPRGGA